jgi:hypothetical protein
MRLNPSLEKRWSLIALALKVAGFQAPIRGWFLAPGDTTAAPILGTRSVNEILHGRRILGCLVEEFFAKQVEIGPTIHLTFNHLKPVNMTFGWTIVPMQR